MQHGLFTLSFQSSAITKSLNQVKFLCFSVCAYVCKISKFLALMHSKFGLTLLILLLWFYTEVTEKNAIINLLYIKIFLLCLFSNFISLLTHEAVHSADRPDVMFFKKILTFFKSHVAVLR